MIRGKGLFLRCLSCDEGYFALEFATRGSEPKGQEGESGLGPRLVDSQSIDLRTNSHLDTTRSTVFLPILVFRLLENH